MKYMVRRNLVGWLTMAGLFLMILSCKRLGSSLGSLDNYAAGSDVYANTCSGVPLEQFVRGTDVLYDRIIVRNELIKYKDDVEYALTSVPEPIKSLFRLHGGRIIIDENVAAQCVANGLKMGYQSTRNGCVVEDLSAGVLAIVLPPDQAEIYFGLTRYFGYVLSKTLVRSKLRGKELIRLTDEPYESRAAKENLAVAFLSELSQKEKTQASALLKRYFTAEDSQAILEVLSEKDSHLTNPSRLYDGIVYRNNAVFDQAKDTQRQRMENDIFAEGFDSMYCNLWHQDPNVNTNVRLKNKFPLTHSTMGYSLQGVYIAVFDTNFYPAVEGRIVKVNRPRGGLALDGSSGAGESYVTVSNEDNMVDPSGYMNTVARRATEATDDQQMTFLPDAAFQGRVNSATRVDLTPGFEPRPGDSRIYSLEEYERDYRSPRARQIVPQSGNLGNKMTALRAITQTGYMGDLRTKRPGSTELEPYRDTDGRPVQVRHRKLMHALMGRSETGIPDPYERQVYSEFHAPTVKEMSDTFYPEVAKPGMAVVKTAALSPGEFDQNNTIASTPKGGINYGGGSYAAPSSPNLQESMADHNSTQSQFLGFDRPKARFGEDGKQLERYVVEVAELPDPAVLKRNGGVVVPVDYVSENLKVANAFQPDTDANQNILPPDISKQEAFRKFHQSKGRESSKGEMYTVYAKRHEETVITKGKALDANGKLVDVDVEVIKTKPVDLSTLPNAKPIINVDTGEVAMIKPQVDVRAAARGISKGLSINAAANTAATAATGNDAIGAAVGNTADLISDPAALKAMGLTKTANVSETLSSLAQKGGNAATQSRIAQSMKEAVTVAKTKAGATTAGGAAGRGLSYIGSGIAKAGGFLVRRAATPLAVAATAADAGRLSYALDGLQKAQGSTMQGEELVQKQQNQIAARLGVSVAEYQNKARYKTMRRSQFNKYMYNIAQAVRERNDFTAADRDMARIQNLMRYDPAFYDEQDRRELEELRRSYQNIRTP